MSTLYVTPLTFTAGTVTLMKAKAFQADWTASATLSETYTFDDLPPTVWINTFPYAVARWATTGRRLPATNRPMPQSPNRPIQCPMPQSLDLQ